MTELVHAAAMPAPQGGALPTGMEWQALEKMATTLADSDVIPYRLKRKPADIAVILLAAREYGIPPLMAMSKLPVVNGTPAPMGELMVALILRAGHYLAADFRNPDGTVYAGGPITREHYGEARYKRRDWTAQELLRFTIDEAVTAGLVSLVDGKPRARDNKDQPTPWELYTPNMARWRAVANAARLNFPDVLLGLSYLPEELGATVDADGAPVMGEVVEPRRQAPPTGSIEQRSAQEAADRLTEYVGPVETLDKVLEHAQTNGYAGELVRYADLDPMPLADAIGIAKERLTATTVPGEGTSLAQAAANAIDRGDLTDLDAARAEAASAGYIDEPVTLGGHTATLREYLDHVETAWARLRSEQEAAASSQEATQEPPTADAAAAAPTDTPAGPQATTERPVGMPASELARAALEEADPEALRDLYRMGSRAGQLDEDVIEVIGDDDLDAINAQGTTRFPLGGFLIAVNAYVTRHGSAVRDLGV